MSEKKTDLAFVLLKFLWENFHKENERLEDFKKRMDGCYFSEKILDFNGLSNFPNFKHYLLFGNGHFLVLFGDDAKSRVADIKNKVDEIVARKENRDGLLFNMLVIFYLEKYRKQVTKITNEAIAQWEQHARIQQSLLLKSCAQFAKVFEHHKDKKFDDWFCAPIRKKLLEIGIKKDQLNEVSEFIQSHTNVRLSEIEANKYPESEQSRRQKDYTELSRKTMQIIFDDLKNWKIPAEEAKRCIAELFDLFTIREISDIRIEFDADEGVSEREVLQISARRIGDVIKKKR